jgi:23S rRNA (guanosine2251-2'-O)-methyltransferase
LTAGHAAVAGADGVQDPHNLGACLRSADAGVHAVIVPREHSAPLSAVSVPQRGGGIHPGISGGESGAHLRALKQASGWRGSQMPTRYLPPDPRRPLALVWRRARAAPSTRRILLLMRIPMAGSVESLMLPSRQEVSLRGRASAAAET